MKKYKIPFLSHYFLGIDNLRIGWKAVQQRVPDAPEKLRKIHL